MTTKKVICTPFAPGPVNNAPYSQAILIDSKTLYVSGTLGLSVKTGKLVDGGFDNEMQQAMKNLEAILRAGNSSFDKLIKVNIFLEDMNNFFQMNEIYRTYVKKNFPARCVVQAARLPINAKVEIEAIAISGDLAPSECTC
ncbi:2-iminobutanoate/2-iminopropanoate deaminase-like [Diabrotica virgifera virgifera]|uniref:2-iminobutanoate/2-iminopropanoate deaminase-like n=1 Tax=Diabrotica virgifera virgifera TaxID=50390 RepID=A0A6P7G5F2_DIAVI|nr:2-iminobutanoate/2-iminopropanoate deaminase-like [Diabrotica virgifera virgifera]